MDILTAKENMLKQQVRTSKITDERIIDAIARIPRQFFVPELYHQLAFADANLSLPHDQVMMTPLEEAQLLTALNIQPTDRILEIGTGTGYLTALLAVLGYHVDSIDIFPDFTESAKHKLALLEITNAHLITANAARGWNEGGAYDVIAITGGLPFLPQELQQQLKIGGRLFAILGKAPTLRATLIEHKSEQNWIEKHLFETWLPYLLHTNKPSQFSF